MKHTCRIWSGVGYLLLLTPIIQTENLALRGVATQSSNWSDYSMAAIDGKRDTHINPPMQDCAHTLIESTPWWRVDLLSVYTISKVSVTNRDFCEWRLDGAEIHIGNSLENNGVHNPRCAVIPSIPAGESHSFLCGEMDGRYVTVVLHGQDRILTLCEVEVYGFPAPPTTSPCPLPTSTPSVNVLLEGRNVTLVGERLCWSDALFYCRDYHWDLLSLTSRGQQMELQRLLGRGIAFPLTPHLWLGQRRYLMGNKWFWMNGDNMTYSQWKWGYAPPQLSNPCGAVASGGDFLWQDRPCEEHLNFLCISGAEEKDSRVSFYSSNRHKSNFP